MNILFRVGTVGLPTNGKRDIRLLSVVVIGQRVLWVVYIYIAIVEMAPSFQTKCCLLRKYKVGLWVECTYGWSVSRIRGCNCATGVSGIVVLNKERLDSMDTGQV